MSEAQGAGLIESLRALGATALALVRVRIDLIAVELKEHSLLHKQMLLLAVVAAFFLAAGFLFLAFFFVVLFWDTHRLAAIGGVTLAYVGIGAWAALRLQDLMNNSPPPFSATLAEFKRDLEQLRGDDE
ncbi:MAG: phage holin family protein [Betaproteobacteria bacterium]|nr:phage holin family protein [Betaproteobacteria bacterium]